MKRLLAFILCLTLALPAQAAWSFLNGLGTANDKTSTHTSFTITTSAAAEVNNVIIVCTAWDNTDTTDLESTRISVSDAAGNTYTRAKEFTNSQGAAAAGATSAIFTSKVTTQLNSGSTITITSDTARVASAATAEEYSFTSTSTISVSGSATAADDGADPSSMTISSLGSQEYLWVHCLAAEGPGTDSNTESTNYTRDGGSGTTGGGTASNMEVLAEHRVFTGTSDSVDMTSNTGDRDYTQTYVALKEVLAAAGKPRRRVVVSQ